MRGRGSSVRSVRAIPLCLIFCADVVYFFRSGEAGSHTFSRELFMKRFAGFAVIVAGLVAGSSVVLAAAAQSRPGAPAVRVLVDPRVELLGIVFRLAGNPEYGKARVEGYTADVEKQFGPYRNHAVVELARKLRSTRGVSFDAVMSMAAHITDTVSIKEKVPFDPHPADLDKRWTTSEAREFLEKLRAFVKESDFNGFVRQHEKLYQTAASRMQDLLRKDAHLEWFEVFFGPRQGAGFTAVPAMLNGGNCYGTRCRTADGKEELFCILGVWMTDAEGLPRFDKSVLPTVIHEFTHSYVNPVVDRHLAELKDAGETLYGQVAEKMAQQNYGSWNTMMYESLVRACVIRYHQKYEGSAAAAAAIEEEKRRGFEWMPGLVSLLGEYETHREANASLDAFMPRIVAYFSENAPKLVKEQKAANSRQPKVVSMTPANGATGVSPSLRAIRVVFDRPMQDGMSVVGGGPNFPELIGKASYDSRHRVLTMPVRLKPGWSYEFWLNSDRFTNFASREGVPLEPVHVTFQTAEKTAMPPAKP